MRTLIVLAAVVLLLALLGWVTFSRDPGRSSINLETDEIKQDTQGVMESGAKLLDDAERAIDPAESPTNVPVEPVEPVEPNSPTGTTAQDQPPSP